MLLWQLRNQKYWKKHFLVCHYNRKSLFSSTLSSIKMLTYMKKIDAYYPWSFIYTYNTNTQKNSVTDRPKCIRRKKADTCHLVKNTSFKGGKRSPKHHKCDFKSKTQMPPEKRVHTNRKNKVPWCSVCSSSEHIKVPRWSRKQVNDHINTS